MNPIKSTLLILLCLTTSYTFAQYTDVINSNRPGVSRSAYSVGVNVAQFEVGPYMIKEKRTPATSYEVDGFGADFAARYGLLWEQLELNIEGTFQSDTKTYTSNISAEDMQALQTNNDNVFAATARPALMKYLQVDKLSPDAKRMVDEMNNWDLVNSENSKGITIFEIVWDSVTEAVWGDELKGYPTALTSPDDFVLVDQLLKDSNWSVADDISTKCKVENFKDQVTLGIENATKKLKKKNRFLSEKKIWRK